METTEPRATPFSGTPRFQLLSFIGKGGMGMVFEAMDLESNCRVALKTLFESEDGEKILRFKKEFRSLCDVQHPNLVHLHELFEAAGHWFFTMELVEGIDFLHFIRGASPVTYSFRTVDSIECSSQTHDAFAYSTTSSHDGLAGMDDQTLSILPASAPQRSWQPLSSCVSAPQTQDDSHLSTLLPFDETRLRQSLKQLAIGLAALHQAGKIHRDIKPSNILVDSSGRLVLLDFGVVGEMNLGGSEESEFVGTVYYMAPEQVSGQSLGPATDWYAMGVLLFQALTHTLPFRGTPPDVRLAKCQLDAPSPCNWNKSLPDDLVGLCERLLARDPRSRPSQEEIFQTLGIDCEWTHSAQVIRAEPRAFVGRAGEIALLQERFQTCTQHNAVFALLEGQSGVGKTQTAQRFLHAVRRDNPSVLILRARCHEKEMLSYNAFDGIIDDLARFLKVQPQDRLAQYLPAHVGSLTRVFPVLGAIPELADASRLEEKGDEAATRAHAFEALCNLLLRISRLHRLILYVDDIHWADVDSLALLRDVLRFPAGTSLFFLATSRPDEDSPAQAILEANGFVTHAHLIGPLPAEEARQLAANLTRSFPASRKLDLERIVKDTGGHPMFIDALVRHLSSQPEESGSTEFALDAALCCRVAALPAPAQALVRAVAVASIPLLHRTLARAAELDTAEYFKLLSMVREANLVRFSGVRQDDTIEAYHDRIREAIYEELPQEERGRLHQRLARVLEEEGAAPEVLAFHYVRGQQPLRGAQHARHAAERANGALAFEQAARHFATALQYGAYPEIERRRLETEQAEALSHAGHARQAAEAYLRAATTGQPSEEERLELERKAAERLLMAGYLAEGLEVTRRVLGSVGLSLPRTPFQAIVRIGWNRFLLWKNGLRWICRTEAEIPRKELYKLDVCWSVAAGLSMVDPIRGAVFSSLLPVLSLRVGEPFRICRALCAMAYSEAAFGQERRCAELLVAMQKATDEHGSMLARFYQLLGEAAVTFSLKNDLKTTAKKCDEAMKIWRRAGRGRAWEMDVMEQFACWSLQLMGNLPELTRRVEAKVRLATATGNRYTEVAFRVCFPLIHLARDEAQKAIDEIDQALSSWLPGSPTFNLPQLWAHEMRIHVIVYRGDLWSAEPLLQSERKKIAHSLLTQVGLLSQEFGRATGLLEMSRAHEARLKGARKQMERHLGGAMAIERKLRRMKFPDIPLVCLVLCGGMAWARGDEGQTVSILRQLIPEATRLNLSILETAAKYRLGLLVGGQEGQMLLAEANTRLALYGVQNPVRYVNLLLGGWTPPDPRN